MRCRWSTKDLFFFFIGELAAFFLLLLLLLSRFMLRVNWMSRGELLSTSPPQLLRLRQHCAWLLRLWKAKKKKKETRRLKNVLWEHVNATNLCCVLPLLFFFFAHFFFLAQKLPAFFWLLLLKRLRRILRFGTSAEEKRRSFFFPLLEVKDLFLFVLTPSQAYSRTQVT